MITTLPWILVEASLKWGRPYISSTLYTLSPVNVQRYAFFSWPLYHNLRGWGKKLTLWLVIFWKDSIKCDKPFKIKGIIWSYLTLMVIYDHWTLSIFLEDVIMNGLRSFLGVTTSFELIKVIRSSSIIAH